MIPTNSFRNRLEFLSKFARIVTGAFQVSILGSIKWKEKTHQSYTYFRIRYAEDSQMSINCWSGEIWIPLGK